MTTIRIVDARQSKRPSLFRMLTAWIMLLGALFWPGIVADSAPMQWAGFIMFLIMTCVFIGRFLDEFKTLDEARDLLNKFETETTDS